MRVMNVTDNRIGLSKRSQDRSWLHMAGHAGVGGDDQEPAIHPPGLPLMTDRRSTGTVRVTITAPSAR